MPHSYTAIIPARNEEKYIRGCVLSLQRAAEQAAVPLEIIVVINRSTDRTEEYAREMDCAIVGSDEKNLARIRNAGASAATGDVLLTVDADSMVSSNMFRAIRTVMESGRYIGGGVAIYPERWSVGIALTYLFMTYYVFRYRISAGLFYCLREDFEAIGGFDDSFVSAEDIDFAIRLKSHGKKRGKRFKTILGASIRTSCRKFDELGDWHLLRHPREFLTVLAGKDQKLADKLWYDFEH